MVGYEKELILLKIKSTRIQDRADIMRISET